MSCTNRKKRSRKSERAVLAGDFEKPVGIESPVDWKVGELDSSEDLDKYMINTVKCFSSALVDY